MTTTTLNDQVAVDICRAAQLPITAPPVLWSGGYTCFVSKRPAETTLRKRLREAGAILISYGSNFSMGYERLYVRFLVQESEQAGEA